MLTWVEINKEALLHNVKAFKGLLDEETILCAVVKANAYGHGIVEASKIFLKGGAEWLAVHSLHEAKTLRGKGIDVPIYILGYVELEDLEKAVGLDCDLVIYNKEAITMLGATGKPVKVHIKVETGTNRQGILLEDLEDFVKYIQEFENIEIEGLSTHFANIEDTTNTSYYQKQLETFQEAEQKLHLLGVDVPIKHCANSAATILFPESHFDMVRVGVALYGIWPSDKTLEAYKTKAQENGFSLQQALTWKVKIAEIKDVPPNTPIGYGCTYQTGRQTKVAVLPIGYYDGYDRKLSNKAYVLIAGKRAPVLGRVCMNVVMVDVTDIPEAKVENEAVLLGKQGDEEITHEKFAEWAETIAYEVPARINDTIKRVVV